MDECSRESLVARFRTFLEEAAHEGMEEGGDEPSLDVADDLVHLYLALTGLKNEVRIESRQFKEALDRFRALFEVMEADRLALAQEMERRRVAGEERAQRSQGAMLLELIGLRDRLERSVVMIEAHQPSFPAGLSHRETAWRSGMAEGLQMLLRRLEQILYGQGIAVIETVDQPLDPRTMRVVGVEDRDDKASGVVVTEDLKGYLWNGQLLRAAEVRTNKKREGAA
ncbi:MAG: nucleotide exchange factor GrpE [Magnetococcales bacterium]|nr:nucleotide exchange factor GrpE [Magnetococcales bacterium]